MPWLRVQEAIAKISFRDKNFWKIKNVKGINATEELQDKVEKISQKVGEKMEEKSLED